jgi:DNA-binding MarR family transcriptional regulator
MQQHDVRLLISRAARTTTRYFGDRASEVDLSIVQAQALLVLTEQPGLNLGLLARALSKDQASTSIVIDRMMTLGLVRRETDPDDRRRALLYTTSQAQPLVDHMQRVRDDINRLVLDAIGTEKSEALESLLLELLAVIEDSEAAPSTARLEDGK